LTTLLIPLKRKYTTRWPCKGVKNQKAGNGKRVTKSGRINWSKGSGMGDKAAKG